MHGELVAAGVAEIAVAITGIDTKSTPMGSVSPALKSERR
jgi:hypothetical protein